MQLLTERYNKKIQGVIACYDRVVIHVVPEADSPRRRTLPGFNYAERMTSFLGRKLHGRYQGDMGNNYNIRIEGSRIKHHMG